MPSQMAYHINALLVVLHASKEKRKRLSKKKESERETEEKESRRDRVTPRAPARTSGTTTRAEVENKKGSTFPF